MSVVGVSMVTRNETFVKQDKAINEIVKRKRRNSRSASFITTLTDLNLSINDLPAITTIKGL